MNNSGLTWYYLRLLESFALLDEGREDERDDVLQDLDRIWLEMDEAHQARSRALAVKAKADYQSLARALGNPSGNMLPSFWEAPARPSSETCSRGWNRPRSAFRSGGQKSAPSISAKMGDR